MFDLASEKLSLLSSAIHSHHILVGDLGFPSFWNCRFLFPLSSGMEERYHRGYWQGCQVCVWGTGRDSNFTVLQCRPKISSQLKTKAVCLSPHTAAAGEQGQGDVPKSERVAQWMGSPFRASFHKQFCLLMQH